MALRRQLKSNSSEKTVVVVDVTDPRQLLEIKKNSGLIPALADNQAAETNTIFNDDSLHAVISKSGKTLTNKRLSCDVRRKEDAQQIVQICPLCHASCKSAACFVNHVMAEHLYNHGTAYTCPFCDYSSMQKAALRSHMQTHTLEKPFVCHICQKSFHQKVGLLQHMKSHSKAKPFGCSLCPSRFKTARSLEVHKAVTHNRLKLYECEVCKMTFGTGSNLRAHMRVHTGERPYRCAICSKCFVQKGHLVTHERLHTGEKPFRCQYCESSFTHAGNLRQHEITQHTKDYKHRCEKCNKGFIGPAELKRHLVSNHTASSEPTRAYMLFFDD